ncbi:hypothetical protein BZG36_03439 [Bifiguratus adelaidae]|uniref:F-actin-capping protein subunit alpha n=1 Tax=Bifiguratus adelaidae TaxID=1938954 RepID=A0A261XY46_9FUNG|nr:hypothetical protein BZG36_03439 [Bifiguratus adelaidae]
MQELSAAERMKAAESFLLQSPPGEINDVFHDIRTLINNDEALQTDVPDALLKYHTEQLTTVSKSNSSDSEQVVISEYNRVEDRFIDPRKRESFRFDSIRQTVEDVQSCEIDEESEPLRSALDTAVQKYALEHYPSGVVGVFSGSEGALHICIIDNKYNPANFWNGRWRSVWSKQANDTTWKGLIKVNVHYYEDGNVQLENEREVEVTIDGREEDHEAYGKALLKQIAAQEKTFQLALNEAYDELAETTFKGLRRALPLTRNKLDWNKILNYRIGNELGSRG